LLKNAVVPADSGPRTVQTGAFRGIRLNLDRRSQSQWYVGSFEREVYPWLSRLSQGAQGAVDIGAASGEYALYFLMKTAARVIAFEPEPESFESLCGNLRLNGLEGASRLELCPKFLAATGGPNQVTPACLAARILTPCLIKMDIDGPEAEVLKSSAELLSLPDVRWLIETHSLDLENQCIAILESFGYSVTIVRNAWWRAITTEQHPIPHNRWLVATK
jgi:precorrin-6B methylase 2